MNDLNTITRINKEAVAAAVPHILERGHFAVEEYSGLSLVNVHERDNETEANALACEIGLKVGHRAAVRGTSHVQLVDATTHPADLRAADPLYFEPDTK